MNIAKKVIFTSGVALLSWVLPSITLAQGLLRDLPQNMGSDGAPMTLLVMSNDHQLYKKAFDDYSDIDGDLELDTTYKDSYDYNGYFDSNLCYDYITDSDLAGVVGESGEGMKFTPVTEAGGTNGHDCTGSQWSGNFLNWVTMTRIDFIRSVLYGGKRIIDTETKTILERAYLPRDAHSFTKIYTGGDIGNYTPFSGSSYTFCNVSLNQNAGPPVFRVASGEWPIWAATERVQCQWNGGGRPSDPGSGVRSDYNVYVEVCAGASEVSNPRCRLYPNGNRKPAGLLQEYGEDNGMRFGLMTGSYDKNLSGGVMRRTIQPIAGAFTPENEGDPNTTDEIDLNNGTFRHRDFVDNNDFHGIIETLDSFFIDELNYEGDTIQGISYNTYSDCASAGITNQSLKDAADGTGSPRQKCSHWGNPIGELYLEALRYLSGEGTPYNRFAADDTAEGFSNLDSVPWDDPYETNPCSECNIILISTGLNSFDGDELSGALSDVPGLSSATLNNYLDNVITNVEGISGDYYIGQAGSNTDGRCTPKTLGEGTPLSSVLGPCPEVPSKEGSYHIAGLAYHAKTNDLRPDESDFPGTQTVTTYAISLAESVPTFEIPVGSQRISFVPTCESNSNGAETSATADNWLACSLVDITVEPSPTGDNQSGSFILYWEDSSLGNDYDNDITARLSYCVGEACGADSNVDANQIQITIQNFYESASYALRLGYTITGVENGGSIYGAFSNTFENNAEFVQEYGNISVDENVEMFGYLIDGAVEYEIKPENAQENANPNNDNLFWAEVYTASSSSSVAQLLENPLWYAAKYGGFDDRDSNDRPNDTNEWDRYDLNGNTNPDNIPDNYFPVRNPNQLAGNLRRVFDDIDEERSASAASFSTAIISESTLAFQAIFSNDNWWGDLVAYEFAGASIGNLVWSAAERMRNNPDRLGRNVLTYNGSTGIEFEYEYLTENQIDRLLVHTVGLDNEARQDYAQNVIDFIKGDSSNEGDNGLGFRARVNGDGDEQYLGPFIFSSPVFVGAPKESYPDDIESVTYSSFKADQLNRTPAVYVGGNAGMMHGFNATADTGGGNEFFGYIPSFLVNDLADLTLNSYQHQSYVDGEISVRDVFVDGAWRTYLVGGARKGGKGVYVLDVTDPSNVGTAQVIGEFTDPDLGYTYGLPQIAKVRTGADSFAWAAIVSSGYQSDSGNNGRLFIIRLGGVGSMTVIRELEVEGQGLSSPTLADLDGDYVIDRVYAGDIEGNMWAFDLGDSEPNNWSSTKLFSSCSQTDSGQCDGDLRQPITVQPSIAFHPSRGSNATSPNLLVYWGTGQYIFEGDRNSTETQTFYAVWDNGQSNMSRDNLQQRSFNNDLAVNELAGSDNGVTYSFDENGLIENAGWYIDLRAGNSDTLEGGRIVIDPVLAGELVFFAVTVPVTDSVSALSCNASNDLGYIIALSAYDGSAPDFNVFDSSDPQPNILGPLMDSLGFDIFGSTAGGLKGVISSQGSGDLESFDPTVNQWMPAGRKTWSILN